MSNGEVTISKQQIINNFNQNRKIYINYALKLTRNLEDAEDLVQTAILNTIKKTSTYTNKNINGWFYTIIKNTFINQYRKNKKHQEYVNDFNKNDNVAFNNIIEDMNVNAIKVAITNVGETLNKPFMLYFEGYKYDEISNMLNIPMGTVKTRIRTCRLKLMDELRHHYPNRDSLIKA